MQALQQAKIIPVIRKASFENINQILSSLYDGGITAIEITAETPDVENLIKEARENHDGLLIGAGTVLDAETARAVIMAGAQFIVSPTVNEQTIRMANRYGIPCISGALTPTEILKAFESGADMIKVFPAGTMGPDYIKNVLGPLPHIPIMATGGIHIDNMAGYFKAGVKTVGIGSQLVSASKLHTEEDYRQLTETAKKYTENASAL
ncbi:bifunctional 4-hydroxy-2-oxoglutarate aldolase/2-dehydro-3-deoxy-phosphogluconate aldolase [Halobacillus campisalis]|uniref:Bifunctional 4-hydroxy-2-oxoglutarate aldolase/2-dehydro-3-deoxy-phosphogluconate aldolase n=1 Tax=Halobacillus campisalis TaxID=435909 RepID=A0ABW2JYU0_9BACI|nr:bifunctional 4-hydroxy-2-oxoglutarate aldolase/2-dehydro-3-deoxy-phosphogluconate aldolase [Halobacillus campisalis]